MKKVIRIWTTLLILALSLTTVAFADIPEKSEDFYVVDEANVISESTEEYIIEKNGDLETLCGGQIVVVAVDFLDGMDIEDYAYKIFNDWGIGSSEKNNGVLLLLAIGEENYWCMQGKGLENEITSADIDDMLWYYLEDDFASANYDAGVKSFFDQMYNAVSVVYGGSTGTESDGYEDIDDFLDYNKTADIMGFVSLIVAAVVILVIIVAVVSIISSSRRNRRTYTPYGPTYPRKTKVRPVIFTSSRPSRSSSSRPSRSSFGGSSSRSSSRPSRSGGGGRSRGGGAGRRGR